MRDELTTVELIKAFPHLLPEPLIVVDIVIHELQHVLRGVTSRFGGNPLEFDLQFGSERNFHAASLAAPPSDKIVLRAGIAMISLRPTNLHWISGSADDLADLCAHAGVEFEVDGDLLVQAGDWTVSAAAVYLLRTLSRSHTKSEPVAEFLFPCCGNGMFDVEGQSDVLIVGCNSGVDFEVVRVEDEVLLTVADGRQHRIAFADWTRAVCRFSDAVQAFYAGASPKQPSDDIEQNGFQKFQSEWSRRRSQAENTTSA